jgi:hypothetical protein
MADDDRGAIRMGSNDNPVVLDQYQTIVEVGWPSFDFAMVPVGVTYEWFGVDTTTSEGTQPKDWDRRSCLPYVVFVGEYPEVAAGNYGVSWLTGLRQFFELGTAAKLRRKRKRKNEAGEIETYVEWVGVPLAVPPEPPEFFGFPKVKTFGEFQFVGTLNLDEVHPEIPFELFVRDPEGFEVKDKAGEIVYVEDAEPGVVEEPIPFIRDTDVRLYFWGWPYVSGPQCVRFEPGTAPEFTTGDEAAEIGAQTEFAPENVSLSGLEIVIKKMRFIYVGLAIDQDSNVGALFERIPNDRPPE